MTTETHDYITKLEKWVVDLMDLYGNMCLDSCYTDNDFIESLIDIGFTEKDFQMFGYGDFVKEYFADDE